jgi:hypothetical protein
MPSRICFTNSLNQTRLPAIPAISPVSATIATTPTTTAATSAPTAAASTVPSTTAATRPSSAASAALRLRPRLIHHQVAPAKILSIQRINGPLHVLIIHFHECEAPGLAREPVADQVDVRRRHAHLRKPLVQLFFCGGKREITDVQFLHLRTPSVRNPLRVAERTEETEGGYERSKMAEPPWTQTVTSAVSGILSKFNRFCNRK